MSDDNAVKEDLPKLLIETGADPNAADVDGHTALHIVARAKPSQYAFPQEQISEAAAAPSAHLLRLRADVDARDKERRTPLHFVEHEAVAELLLSHRADAAAADAKGQTRLHRSADPVLAEVLLAKRADPAKKDKLGAAPLHTTNLDAKVAHVLLQARADVNVKGPGNRTPLHYAGQAQNQELIQTLLSNRADPEAKDVFDQAPRLPEASK
eukprot:gnl/TRDRNA2_/TRDRNA2_143465_c0_seq1.p1 gnl/TRDRNA2_/TRDRNA2_143465_c0~~gnl/TRDRNA2_/TRDRNA2_143465_c0_seq1.p1  ORF type:complete len:211 (+),score=48.40 gnl/TRDRNA2_/TRDRNA2_143465_c0_seq1:59-691(+)